MAKVSQDIAETHRLITLLQTGDGDGALAQFGLIVSRRRLEISDAALNAFVAAFSIGQPRSGAKLGA